MLKKTITYTDYNDKEQTEEFYFNLSKAELAEIEMSEKQGLHALVKEITQSEDAQQILVIFKMIVSRAIGQKSADGKRFIKNDDIRNNFFESEAYSEFFMEIMTDPDAAAVFVRGIIPAAALEEFDKTTDEN